MKEENSCIINARYLPLDEYDVAKPCTLFFNRNRIIVVSLEGMNPWTVVTVIVALAASFTGLLLRNFFLLFGGLGAGITAGILIVIIDFLIRRKKLSKMKRLSPERILETSEENFEVRFAEIVKAEVRTFKTYSKGSLLLPSLQENQYAVDLATNQKKYRFILDRNKLQQCINMLRQFAPETIEIDEV